MSKTIILNNLQKLTEALKTQNRNIEFLNSGVDIPKERMSSRDECSFLSWFREDGKFLRAYVHGTTIDEVTALHSQWYKIYEKIYKLFYSEEKKGWFKRSSRSPKKLNEMELSKLEAYIHDIKPLHDPLLRKLKILEQRIESNATITDETYHTFVNNSSYQHENAM